MWCPTLCLNLYAFLVAANPTSPQFRILNPNIDNHQVCQKTEVAILGAGVAGITAAQTLSKEGVNDFLLVEYNDEIGGRCRASQFGTDQEGNPYTVEIGANWIQGTVSDDGPENPIWKLAKKYNIANHVSNFSSLMTYNETGQVDFLDKLVEFDTAYSSVQQSVARSSNKKGQDEDLRSALKVAGYNPDKDPQAQAIDWFRTDYEYAQSSERSSRDFTIANYNSTFGTFSHKSNFAFDQRGFNTFIHGQAAEFLKPNDQRLLLNKAVKNIAWSDESTTTYMTDGTCIEAAYVINTFSLGVLRSGDVAFSPPLPKWKRDAINTFQFGTFTKIFIQFAPSEVFWDRSTEFFLYASPTTRGYFPVWQSLDHPDFLPGSGILMTTVVAEQAHRVEAQDDAAMKHEVLEVLREMFGRDAVPEPLGFMYPRWSTTPWSYGSFSNWPPGFTLDDHKALRANNGRMWYAGEATSEKYYGYLHGAYFEGEAVGYNVAACVKDAGSSSCQQMGSI